ncbi:IS110 family transposase, partial [Rhizobiaceae bacterium n13]|nr:IS110 family transposase [Fererhizobium litorale]
ALRSVLYEFGHPIPAGIGHLKRIEAMVEAENSDLPELVRDESRDLLLQIAEKTQRIERKTKQIGAMGPC